MTSRPLIWLLAVTVPFVVAASAWGQAQEDQGPPRMRGTPPGRISSLGGVRSQPGVKSAAPRGTATPIQVRPIQPSSGFSRPINTRPHYVPRVPRGGDHGHHGSHFGGGYGFRFSGTYQDGPFKLVFSSGGLRRIHLPKDGFIVPVYTGGYAAVLPYGGLGWYFGNGSYFSCGYRGVVGPAWYDRVPASETTPTSMAAAPTEAERPMTPLEYAAALLRSGDPKAAVSAYQAYLKAHPLDAVAMRSLGLSLIDAGQVGDGIAVIGLAYRSDSTLAAAPIDDGMFGKITRYRSNLGRVSSYANREKSASAWLSLAVLMQGEGRQDRALAMIERAKSAGLEEALVQEMTAALSARADAGG